MLALAGLSPKVLNALAADRIDVATAQAFTLTDDQQRQQKVLKSARTAHEVRRLLTEAKLNRIGNPTSQQAAAPATCSARMVTVTPMTRRWCSISPTRSSRNRGTGDRGRGSRMGRGHHVGADALRVLFAAPALS